MNVRPRWLVRVGFALVFACAAAYAVYEVVESPANQLFGQTLVSGPKDRHVVALTYDDGPNPPYTNELLGVLSAERVHATFFVVGRAVAAYPQVVRQERLDGDAIGNHTWSHEHLVLDDAKALRTTLERTDRAIYAAAGVHPRIMRPPFGGRDWLVIGEVRKLGYTPVMWSVPLPKDWEYPPARVIAARVLRYATDGAIIALHDGNEGILCKKRHLSPRVCDRSADVGATKLIVEALKRRGYRFVTIPELLNLNAKDATRTDARANE